eukprot:5474746-Amphidinium_carterae.3
MLTNSSLSISCLFSLNSASVVLVLFFCLSDRSLCASMLASISPYCHMSTVVPRTLRTLHTQFHGTTLGIK